jgi:hypothetical protein
MSSNGRRQPPRPRIELAAGAASPQEAAAVVAAIERHLIETAPAPQAGPTMSRWQRAALVEGVGARRALPPPAAGPQT